MPRPRSEADDQLASRLSEVLVAANRRYRKQLPFGAAFVTPAIPDVLIAKVADGLVPLLRELVAEAVGAQDPTDAAWAAHLHHIASPSVTTDLRPVV